MLEHFQTNRQVLFDLTANYLEPLNGFFQRLSYVAGLRVYPSNKYFHERLAAIYGADRVDQVLASSHEELFERLLEMPLSAQEDDLRRHLSTLPGVFVDNAKNCRELALTWVPPQTASYLTELYSANLSVLRELLLDNTATAR